MPCTVIPEGEPGCQPSWPDAFDGVHNIGSDDDGDGVQNDNDNCPPVFNSIRLMDDGQQPD